MSLIGEILDRVFRPNRDPHPVPVLDGPFSPNRLLEQALPVNASLPEADDFLVLDASSDPVTFLVATPEGLLKLAGEKLSVFADIGMVGALAPRAPGGVYAFSEEGGILALDAEGRLLWQTKEVRARALRSVTQISVGLDGMLYVSNGSDENRIANWKRDLMQRRAPSGFIAVIDPSNGSGRILTEGLSWPAGVAVTSDGRSLWYNECWAQRLWRMDLATGKQCLCVRNFTGYPGRILPQGEGFWMNFFALRTELTEFVLRERAFCERMMAEVPRDIWIGPALNSRMSHLAPTQIGGIKKLGIEKAWSPPRSYGLVALFNREGEGLTSWHSRVGGPFHGITALRVAGCRVFALSKGDGVLVELPGTQAWLKEL